MAKQILIIDSLGRELAKMRKHQNWTQEKLAELSGVSDVTISRIENEEIHPTTETVQKLLLPFGKLYTVKFALEDNSKQLTSEIVKKKQRF